MTAHKKSFTDGVQITHSMTEEKKLITLFEKATVVGECWLCHVKPNAKGYCYITIGRGRKERAHRFVFKMTQNAISDDLVVMHTCDVRNCINPAHLKAGTVADNQQDMKNKKRGAGKPPSTNWDANQEVINLYRSGCTLKEIAKHQGVGVSTVAYRLKRAREFSL